MLGVMGEQWALGRCSWWMVVDGCGWLGPRMVGGCGWVQEWVDSVLWRETGASTSELRAFFDQITRGCRSAALQPCTRPACLPQNGSAHGLCVFYVGTAADERHDGDHGTPPTFVTSSQRIFLGVSYHRFNNRRVSTRKASITA